MEHKFIFDRKDVDLVIKDLTFFDITKHSLDFFISCVKYFDLDNESFERKIEAYHSIWNNTIDDMYLKNMPLLKNECEIGFELTPFTVLMAEINNTDLTKILNLSDVDKKYCENMYDKFITKKMCTCKNDLKANFILCILIAPPILAISEFYRRVYSECTKKATLILNVVQNNTFEMPKYKCNLGMGFATNFLNQNIYEKYNKMNGLIDNPLFLNVHEQLQDIKNECDTSGKLPNKTICPYCGELHEITLTQDDIFFAHLTILHKEVQAKLVLSIMDDYKNMVASYVIQSLSNINENINSVENPKCYILVEGTTEETAIPYMAIKYNKPLSLKDIKVWNSKTKEKVYMDFEKIKKNHPDSKICVLLDGDAKKEIENIQRIIKNKKNQYVLHYIQNGTFEDLIDVDISIAALNKIYGKDIFNKNDFNESKSFLNQVEKKIYDEKLTKFDKVTFIKNVLMLINNNNIPSLIKTLIDDCYNMVEQ